MSEQATRAIYHRIGRLRWQVPLLALVLVLLHQVVEHTWLRQLPHWQHFASQVLFYGLVGPLAAWWALSSIRRSVDQTARAQQALETAHEQLQKANRRLKLLIRINRRLAEVEDEEALVDAIVTLPQQVLPVAAVSLVRLDEHQRPTLPIFSGDLDPDAIAALSRELSSELSQIQCASCVAGEADRAAPCTLLSAAMRNEDVRRVYCFALTRGPRRYGFLNVYLDWDSHLSANEHSLLKGLAYEASLALESQRLRTRELKMLVRLQQTSWWSDLEEDLSGVLAHTAEVLEADGGVLLVDALHPDASPIEIVVGRALGGRAEMVYRLADTSRTSGQRLAIRDLEEDGNLVRSLLANPLSVEDQTLGVLVLWAARPAAFGRRQQQLVGVVAGQAALLVENRRLSAQVEHQAALAERARLAREIHDGLAQTLGYLKLRTAQLVHRQGSGEQVVALSDLEKLDRWLNEAYLEARQAIDDLSFTPSVGLQKWSRELADDLEGVSDVSVTIEGEDIQLEPETEAHLQRIVQEAFSNARKHAGAKNVHLNWQLDKEGELLISIVDDGCGFDPNAERPEDSHGLRTMQERAALLGADLQITSGPGQGTEVLVRLPASARPKDKVRDGQTD